jgi:hypothetical protein
MKKSVLLFILSLPALAGRSTSEVIDDNTVGGF